ncbi:MAG TPA: glutamate--tRNA ligase [Casimicrobiaceae bacterium]|jgi:glutamyl-tRNA synthetase|nr:glutamate--tRNA ligase [Casimicrobiaceae bacterium]
MHPVRTRFAPSPTGYLHLGNIRSALYPWAYARKHGGAFVLRIEDTDAERSTQEAVQAILDSMAWLGLEYDEGPVYQSQRMDRYAEVIAAMLAGGTAYHCYATADELDALRAAQLARGEKPRYDRRWRPEPGKTLPAPPAGIPPVVRFRNPLGGVVDWQDAVKGRIEIGNDELDDLIIARSDGAPTYNFCVVVDDLDMRITHVIRGDDHVNNTPRQINMIRALGGTEPVYAHLPTVLTPEGDKLSKRHGARGVLQYRDDGYLPEAMVNYLARLGWAHGDAEIFSCGEFVDWFDLAHLSSAPGRFDPEKLKWVNHEHIKRLPADELGRRLRPFLERAGLDVAAGPAPASVAELFRDRIATLAEMVDAAHYFYADPTHAINVPTKFAEVMTDPVRSALPELLAAFESVEWTREAIGATIKAVAAKCGLKTSQLMMAARALVTGEPQTPPIDAVLALLGRQHTIDRLHRGLAG